MSNYRVKYKKGEVEIEVESTDKAYVDKKLTELLSSSEEPRKPTPSKRSKTNKANDSGGGTGQVDVPAVVDAINDFDDHEKIEEHILKKPGQLPRIIMCLKFAASTLDSPLLTTGDIETITDQLGVKLFSRNAASAIKKNQKYFTLDSVRKPGAIVKYKLNRKGETAYETLLKGKKLS